MIDGILLDTCALVWIWNDAGVDHEARGLIDDMSESGMAFVSPITAWEIGTLIRKRRLTLTMAVEDWLDLYMRKSNWRFTELSPRILVESTRLPSCELRDPADQILTATARMLGLIMVTRDASILTYADQGHLRAAAC